MFLYLETIYIHATNRRGTITDYDNGKILLLVDMRGKEYLCRADVTRVDIEFIRVELRLVDITRV